MPAVENQDVVSGPMSVNLIDEFDARQIRSLRFDGRQIHQLLGSRTMAHYILKQKYVPQQREGIHNRPSRLAVVVRAGLRRQHRERLLERGSAG